MDGSLFSKYLLSMPSGLFDGLSEKRELVEGHGSAGQDEEHSGHYSAVSVKKVPCLPYLPYFQAVFCFSNRKALTFDG